jgi:hypothetical protein
MHEIGRGTSSKERPPYTVCTSANRLYLCLKVGVLPGSVVVVSAVVPVPELCFPQSEIMLIHPFAGKAGPLFTSPAPKSGTQAGTQACWSVWLCSLCWLLIWLPPPPPWEESPAPSPSSASL